MRYFCTYFDRHYLLRALALYQSLRTHAGEFTLWALCFDDESYRLISALNWPGLHPVALPELEVGDAELLNVKPTRSRVEYYFTCSPSLPLLLMPRVPPGELLTYLDADLFFFASPEPVFAEMGDASVLIIGHRFPDELRHMESSGVYNVGFLSFRHDAAGMECLRWWRERCLEWCYDRYEPGHYADQKYLDNWPERFPRTHVLRHKGAGLAPWNWMNHSITGAGENITVDGQPLIFFHYHALKVFNSWLYDPVRTGKLYGEMPRRLLSLLYVPYMAVLKNIEQRLRQVEPDYKPQYDRVSAYGWRIFLSKVRRGKLALYSGAR